MSWNLFVDDERSPCDVTWAPGAVLELYSTEDWVIARSVPDALSEIANRGMPSFMSLDHDLGTDLTGYDLVKTLVYDAVAFSDSPRYTFPDNFKFYVHSKNIVGKANIESLLSSYFDVLERISGVPVDEDRADELFDISLCDDDGDITVGKLK